MKNMDFEIVFRADANPNIGMGHVMRCLSIADAFQSMGKRVLFIVADDSVVNLINSRGFDTYVLKSDYKDMESELSMWPEWLLTKILIVDSYLLSFLFDYFLNDCIFYQINIFVHHYAYFYFY